MVPRFCTAMISLAEHINQLARGAQKNHYAGD